MFCYLDWGLYFCFLGLLINGFGFGTNDQGSLCNAVDSSMLAYKHYKITLKRLKTIFNNYTLASLGHLFQ